MVKDEALVIEKTLQPFVDVGISSFLVVDTGSTDNTVEVTQQFFKKNNISESYIKQELFIDFATSRNKVLEHADHLFPHAAFMTMIDAEWYLHNVQGLLNFCELCLKRSDMYSAYLIRIFNNQTDFYVPRLIKCRCNVRFEGVVHETIICQTRVKVPATVFFEYKPTKYGIDKTKKRYKNDKKKLYKEYINNPTDKRTLFYLAFTCEALNNLEEAYDFYQKRIVLGDCDEEDFISHYRLAQIIEKLSFFNSHYTWQEALVYYQKAYVMRPHRIEPLIKIAHYYISQGNNISALPYVQLAITVPYPTEDVLFIEKDVYDYIRYDLLRKCEQDAFV